MGVVLLTLSCAVLGAVMMKDTVRELGITPSILSSKRKRKTSCQRKSQGNTVTDQTSADVNHHSSIAFKDQEQLLSTVMPLYTS